MTPESPQATARALADDKLRARIAELVYRTKVEPARSSHDSDAVAGRIMGWIKERDVKRAVPSTPAPRPQEGEAEPVLPCDVTLGNCTFRKGVKMSVLQSKLDRMYERYAGLARHWAERSVTPIPPIEESDDV